MKNYLINSKNDLYNIGLKSQLGPIVIQGRLETVFHAQGHVVNTIERTGPKEAKMRKYSLEHMDGLDDFSELDISFEHPMFRRLREKLFIIDPDF